MFGPSRRPQDVDFPIERRFPGRWHTYPEMAAAGLWTTAAELMRFGSELRKSALGQSNRVLTKQTTESMLTSQHGGYGLGVALSKQVRGASRTAEPTRDIAAS